LSTSFSEPNRGGRPEYRDLDQLVALIDEPMAASCRSILERHGTALGLAAGATHNHQTWPGGYLDHIREVMNIAVALFPPLQSRRSLPFSLSDVLLVLFLHDLEKPWRQSPDQVGDVLRGNRTWDLESHQGKQEFRLAVAAEHGIQLSADQENAIDFIEGEGGRYSPKTRSMGQLAAFCHACDTLSARLWFDHPSLGADSWSPPRSGR
jgi:hypothetical protein